MLIGPFEVQRSKRERDFEVYYLHSWLKSNFRKQIDLFRIPSTSRIVLSIVSRHAPLSAIRSLKFQSHKSKSDRHEFRFRLGCRALIRRDRFSTRARNNESSLVLSRRGTSFPSTFPLVRFVFYFLRESPPKIPPVEWKSGRFLSPLSYPFVNPGTTEQVKSLESLVIAFSRPPRLLGTSSEDQRESTLSFHHFESRDLVTLFAIWQIVPQNLANFPVTKKERETHFLLPRTSKRQGKAPRELFLRISRMLRGSCENSRIRECEIEKEREREDGFKRLDVTRRHPCTSRF